MMNHEEIFFQSHDEKQRAIWMWHMLEESEHKDIAYDVFQSLSNSYGLRIAGFFPALIIILVLISIASLLVPFYRKPSNLLSLSYWKDLPRSIKLIFGLQDGVYGSSWAHILDFLRPGFHPNDHDTSAFALQCDVGVAEKVQQLAEQSEQLLGHPVTLLINNAGVGLGGKFDEVSLADWQWCMQVNLWGVIHGCHYFVPKLKQRGGGAIINVASAAGYTAAPEMTAYNVSKSSVLALSETLSAELRGANIRINVLCPTLVPTNIMKNGRLPAHYSGLADHLLTHHAFVSCEQVVAQTLNNLDRGEMYTIPQPDAKLFWWFKRAAPRLYTKLLGVGYPLFNKYVQKS